MCSIQLSPAKWSPPCLTVPTTSRTARSSQFSGWSQTMRRLDGYRTGRDSGLFGQEHITQTCNVITLVGAAATTAGGGGKVRWRARPCPLVGSPSFLRRPSFYSYHDRKYSKDIEPDAVFAFDLATEEWKSSSVGRGRASSYLCWMAAWSRHFT